MNKADQLFVQNLLKIKHEGYSTHGDVRPILSDGSKAQSRYVTNVYEEYDLEKNEFPITTLRPIAWKTAIKELFVIYVDQEHTQKAFHNRGIKYWDEWMFPKKVEHRAYADNMEYCIGQGVKLDRYGKEILWGGCRYGETVAKYNIIDTLLEELHQNKFNRRSIINLWQYADFNETEGLKPCAFQTMFDVREKDGVTYLDCSLIQRSNDIMVAGAINKIQYVALQMMVAHHFGWEIGKFSHYVMNLHYYHNQEKQLDEQLARVYEFENWCTSSHIPHSFMKQCNLDLLRWMSDNGKDLDGDLILPTEVCKHATGTSEYTGTYVNMMSDPILILDAPEGCSFYDITPEMFKMVNYHPDKRQLKFELAI